MFLDIQRKIEIRPGHVRQTPGRDLTCQPKPEVNMPMSHDMRSCAFAHDVSLPHGFAVQCRFPGLDGTYLISSLEHLNELACDPVGFAADLAGLSRSQYVELLRVLS